MTTPSADRSSVALKRTGLGGKPIVMPVIDAAVKRHGLKVVPTSITVRIDDPKQALNDLQKGGFDDSKCLRETLDDIDQKLPDVVRQANAWATGDVAALRTRPTQKGPGCFEAVMESDFVRKRGCARASAQQLGQGRRRGADPQCLNVCGAVIGVRGRPRQLPRHDARQGI